MEDDTELLGRFACDRDEAAFAEVVRRNIDCVYRTALRQVNADAHLAQDVTQAVFLTLARRAGEIARHRTLSGWLHLTARFCASAAMRSERRRQKREQEAHAMIDESTHAPTAATWAELSPILDELLQEMKAADREALLMRYYEDRPFAELGARLGLPANTARMRVERALDKLRLRLERRGITSTASALGAVLASQPLAGAPADLAEVVVESALEEATALGIGTAAVATTAFMSTTKNVSIGVGLVALLAIAYFAGVRRPPSAEERALEAELRGQIAQLRQENRRLVSELQRQPSKAAAPGAVDPGQPVVPGPMAAVPPYNPGPPPRLVGNSATMPQLVIQNLRRISTAANRFRQEKGRDPASIEELVGPGGNIAELGAVDGESYANLDFSPNGTMSVVTAGGITVAFAHTAGRGAPLKTTYEEAVERARAAFSAAHGRTATGSEAAAFIDDPAFRETFLDQTRGQAMVRGFDPGFMPVLRAASAAYTAAYQAAHGGPPPGTFQSYWSMVPFIENDSDRARFFTMLREVAGP